MWICKIYVCPAIRSGEGVDLDSSFACFKLFRVKNVEKSAGIMDRRIRKFIIIKVHDFKLFQHVVDGLSEGNTFISLEVVDYLLSSHILMGDF